MNNKVILDLCGGTGAWSQKYKEAGYIIINVTLPDYDILKTKIMAGYILFKGGNKMPIAIEIDDIYGILASPVCTMFSLARTRAKTPRNLRQGMKLVIASLNIIWECRYDHKLAFWAMENPMGILRQFLGIPVLTFDPCDYGDPYKKKTDIWGYFNIPKKKPVDPISYISAGKRFPPLWGKTGGKSERTKMLRAMTPQGFARAFFEANK